MEGFVHISLLDYKRNWHFKEAPWVFQSRKKIGGDSHCHTYNFVRRFHGSQVDSSTKCRVEGLYQGSGRVHGCIKDPVEGVVVLRARLRLLKGWIAKFCDFDKAVALNLSMPYDRLSARSGAEKPSDQNPFRPRMWSSVDPTVSGTSTIFGRVSPEKMIGFFFPVAFGDWFKQYSPVSVKQEIWTHTLGIK
ncbi:hypothetical protein CKAN_02145900 [Cinnamomum micranthum f. kanehirae]|uniref:Uncharacterized protein n=1 Tax=Cinnamomum micranthum f. kanehirae TaxID=337451 RepID=A0A443PNA0_9MAGN|nr:hypothetical protein CKAN_02145900 [Cinnamomum micranthum f. kanehirae]